MFKRMMASLGVGSAKVDLVLDNDHCRIGEAITGKVMVKGGNVDQDIHNIDFDLVMKFNVKGKEFTKVVDTIRVVRDLSIQAKETRALPFEHQLPFHYPISKGSVSYYLNTKMDIARAIDTGDTDKLVILPDRDMELIMRALESLGFREKIGSGRIGRYGQEFEYYPSAYFENTLKELEIKFYKDEHNLKMFLELELNGGYFKHGAEHHTELTLPSGLLAEGSVEKTARYIEEFLENELNYAAQEGPMRVPSYQNYHQHRQQGHGGFGFGGFMGGIVTGMLGAAMLDSLFNDEENEAGDEIASNEELDAGGGEEDGGGFFDFGDFGDF